jgi:hypothetical protein
MAIQIDPPPPDEARPFRWRDRVASSSAGDSFAFVPNRIVLRSADEASARRLIPQLSELESVREATDEFVVFQGAREGNIDVVAWVGRLRAAGLIAQPDHVFFAHPLYGNPLYGNPLYGNPLYGNPLYGNPLYGNPLYGNPLYGNSHKIELPKASSAVPVDTPDWYEAPPAKATGKPSVVIIDSGLIDSTMLLKGWLPTAAKIDSDNYDPPDSGADHWLDPVAGHGTFIAGIIDVYAPGCSITVVDRLEATGQCSEFDIRDTINRLIAGNLTLNGAAVPVPDLLNLSFGGTVLEDAFALKSAIHAAQLAGMVVVASAGNDGSSRRSYPAAFPGVVSVGAVGPNGPATFTNYGEWVRACAPGVDVVSGFYNGFNGIGAPFAGRDTDEFCGWAKWNGSSFAAPRVVAALIREMRLSGCTAKKAVERVIDAEWLARIPGLGTVVNL